MTKLLKRSPHYGQHARHNPKQFFDFAGWEMPTHFSSLEEEIKACRESAILFDGHAMGEFHIQGKEALKAVQKLCANDISKAKPGQLVYTSMCTEQGGIFDDLVVFCISPEHYLMTVAAFNVDKAPAWICKYIAGLDAHLCDLTSGTTCIEIQGPKSREILQKVAEFDISNERLPYYRFIPGKVGKVDCLVGRLGVTGELGYEIFYDPGHAWYMYDLLMEAGGSDLALCGNRTIGVIRLEKVYHVYTRDIDETTNPYEAGLGRAVKLEKGDFIGRDALAQIQKQGVSRKLVGMVAEPGTKISVPKTAIFNDDGKQVGYVTAMAESPTLGMPIALGYVSVEFSDVGSELTVGTITANIKTRVVPIPFYDPEGKRLRI